VKARVSCFVFQIFRACSAPAAPWPLAAPAAGSHLSGTKTSYALRGFRLRGATDVTFGGNRYCQDPICMSGRLHAWAKLVCTCKQLRLRFNASDSWRRSKAAAAAAAVAARCASEAQAAASASAASSSSDSIEAQAPPDVAVSASATTASVRAKLTSALDCGRRWARLLRGVARA
jgi:hypothetical protein